MALSTRTFRVFVSSTFSDLKAERNALQEKVFPRLRELAAVHGCRFQAIDLRWGVSEEAALDQKTMNICLGEIDRCQKTSPRPNFIVLLGDRYGWRPLPAEIPADEFKKINAKAAKEQKALLAKWYQRDDNAIPAVYCLLPRSGKFVDYAVWEPVEDELRLILQEAIRKLSLPPDATLKYTASATEQEIVAGALKVPDAGEHVFCFFRELEGMPKDESSLDYRNADAEADQRQKKLKERLRKQLNGNVHEYKARWQEEGPSLNHLDQLCEDVYAALSGIILAEIETIATIDSLDREILAHDGFGKERTRIFVGRAESLKAISDYAVGTDPHILVIWGASGSGKSALMAKAVEQAQKGGREPLSRFIGATPETSNGRVLLESLCRQISRRFGADESAIPSAYQDLVQEFSRCLALATKAKPIVLFMDALDQLSDDNESRGLEWLPAKLPPHVRLVVSTLPGDCLQALRTRVPKKNCIEVPSLSRKDGTAILTQLQEQVNRGLQKEQTEYLIGRFAKCALPLYLKLAFEEARLWKSFDPIPKLGKDIPGILHDLFKRLSLESNHGNLLVSHSLGYLAAAKNGLSDDELLDVLSIDQEVLADFRRRSPKSPKMDSLPVVVLSRLYFDLEPYLSERAADGTSLMAFYHRQMIEAVNAAYLSGDDKLERHNVLARYFAGQPLQKEQASQKTANLRKLSEQPYQQTHGRLWSDLRETLTSFEFIEAKCKSLSVYDLESDFQTGVDAWDGAPKDKEVVVAFRDRLDLESHIINSNPGLLFPHLYNQLTWLDAPDGPIHELCEQAATKRHGWLRMTLDPTPQSSSWLRSLEGHVAQIYDVAITPDGRHVISTSEDRTIKVWDLESCQLVLSMPGRAGAVTVTPDGEQIVSASGVWDLRTGRRLRSMDGAYAVALTPDGKSVISASGDDGAIKVWDLHNGQLLRSLEGHADNVTELAVTPDGMKLVSGSNDMTLRVWDLQTGSLLRSLGGSASCVGAMTITPDGKKVIASQGYTPEKKNATSSPDDFSIKIWELRTGRLVRSLDGHTGLINAVRVTPDGKQLISASEDHTIKIWDLESGRVHGSQKLSPGKATALAIAPDGKRFVSASGGSSLQGGYATVWDLQSGKELGRLEGHVSFVMAAAVTPDGTKVVSGSFDKTIKIWDRKSGGLLCTLGTHNGYVNAVAVTPDGKQVISASEDRTVSVWDLQECRLLRSLEGHKKPVKAVAVSPDGRHIVSASEDRTNVWDLQSGRLLRFLPDGEHPVFFVRALAITPDSKNIVTGVRHVGLWDLESGRFVRYLEGHTDSVHAVAVTPDGKQVISTSRDQTLKVWDLRSGRLLRSMTGQTEFMSALAITPDGKQVLAADERVIRIWGLGDGRLLRSLEGHSNRVNAVVVTPDGSQVISASHDKTLKIWDLRRDDIRRCVEGHAERVTAVALTPDGTKVVSGSQDKTVKVWDRRTGHLLLTLEGHTDNVDALAITPDGKLVVSSDYRGPLRVWELATGRLLGTAPGSRELAVTPDCKRVVSCMGDRIVVSNLPSDRPQHTLEGHTDEVQAVAMGPQGKLVVSGSIDQTIRVWDLAGGRLLRTMEVPSQRQTAQTPDEGHASDVTALAVTPDGTKVIAALYDDSLQTWDIQNGQLLRRMQGKTDDRSTLAITPDGKQVISGLRAWDLESGDFKDLLGSKLRRTATDGHWLAAGDDEGHVYIFEWMK